MRLARISSQLDIQSRTVLRLNDIYSRARSFQSDHDTIMADVCAVWDSPEVKRVSQAIRAYLRGYRDALSTALWQEMEWRLGPADGPLSHEDQKRGWMSLDRPNGGKLSILCREKGALYGGHFWKGTDKPFTAYHCING